MSKGFYAVLALCLVGAGATAWIATDRTLDGLQRQNQQLAQQSQSSPAPQDGEKEGEIVWETPQTPARGNVSSLPKSSSSSSQPSSSSGSQQQSSAPEGQSGQQAISPRRSGSAFVLPVPGEVFNRFSNGRLVKNDTLKVWRTHDGADFRAGRGEDVVAVQTGTVTAVRSDTLWGWVVEIDHGGGLTSVTCGLSEKVSVQQGERVSAGQVIGRVGRVPAELSLPSHIHLEMYRSGAAVDPLKAMGKI